VSEASGSLTLEFKALRKNQIPYRRGRGGPAGCAHYMQQAVCRLTSRPKQVMAAVACQRIPVANTTCRDRADGKADSGIGFGQVGAGSRVRRRMRFWGILASSSERAVAATIRSWQEKRLPRRRTARWEGRTRPDETVGGVGGKLRTRCQSRTR